MIYSSPMRRRLSTFLRLDPTLFVAAFALWAALSGLSILASQDIMQRAVAYTWLRELPIHENYMGTLIVVDSVLMFLACSHKALLFRLPVAILSGVFWFFWGGGQIVGAAMAGIMSGNGVWNALCGIGLVVSAVQWINREIMG